MNAASALRQRSALERCTLLRGLPPDLLERIAAHASQARFDEGDTLFFKNDPGDFLGLVLEGGIYRILYGPDGQELIVGTIGPGEAVDEAVLLDRDRRSFTAVACADTVVLKLPRRHFDALTAQPVVLARAHAALCRHLRQAIEHLETMCLHRLEARLARYLLLQMRGDARDGGVVEIALPPNQRILAAMINASRPKLNAQLQRWQRSGLATRRRNLLRIHDLREFRSRACLLPEGGAPSRSGPPRIAASGRPAFDA